MINGVGFVGEKANGFNLGRVPQHLVGDTQNLLGVDAAADAKRHVVKIVKSVVGAV